jgi:hypothetical protein
MFFEIFLDNIIFARIFRLKNDISLIWIIQKGAQVKEEKAESILNTAKKNVAAPNRPQMPSARHRS